MCYAVADSIVRSTKQQDLCGLAKCLQHGHLAEMHVKLSVQIACRTLVRASYTAKLRKKHPTKLRTGASWRGGVEITPFVVEGQAADV